MSGGGAAVPDRTVPGPEADPDNAELRRKVMGFITSQVIFAVCELGVVDRLGDGPARTAELAAAVGADADALARFVRVLVAEGLLVEEPPGTVALTRLGGLLRSDAPGSLGHFSRLMAGEAYTAWSAALYSVRTGGPAFDVVFGKPYFEWLAEHPDASAGFNRAQAGLAELRMLPLLERDWQGVTTVVDVGGGHGRLLASLLTRHPHLRGVLFDLPHVAGEAAPVLRAAGVDGRCRCLGGDFFREVPVGGQAYVLAQVLHDWDDAPAVAILRRCRRAMTPDARLLVVEQVVREDGRPHPAKLLDLHMLVMLGGRERTEQAWHRLLAAAGFTVTGMTEGARSTLIEARPAGADIDRV